jgi:hypothetical protein
MQLQHRRFFIPFAKEKIDKERRIVWGIAQEESVDTQDDRLMYDASVAAFSAWAGNIREQHDDSKAVGRAIEIIADPKAKTITVGARISLGAEDTWQKVLDGTLTGYSIGGVLQEFALDYDPEYQRNIRNVTKYELYELSLVDVPANSGCVITAVQKRGTHLVATDVLAHSLGALTASDVLNMKKASQPMPNAKRAKVQTIVSFAKSLGANDEVILLRTSDLSKAKDGSIVLKSTAPVSGIIRKDDLDADGYTDESDDTSSENEPEQIDFEQHAENAAKMHKAFCKMGGIDDNEGHYLESTKEDGDDDMAMGDEPKDDPSGMKSRRLRREKARRIEAAKSATQSKLEAQVAALSDQVVALTKTLSSGGSTTAVTPRVGAGQAGTVVEKGGVAVANSQEARLAELKSKAAEMVKSGSKGLTQKDRAERDATLNEILSLETAIRAGFDPKA